MIAPALLARVAGAVAAIGAWFRPEPEPPLLLIDHLPPPPTADPARSTRAAGESARAALIDALNPSLPVADRDQLLGRETELRRIFAAIADLRGHAIVHGPRGAGKTSLARAFGDYADERGLTVLYLSCDGGTRFADLFRPFLDFLPDDSFAAAEREEVRAAIAALPADFGPRAFASLLARVDARRIVLILDEFDRIAAPAVRAEVATLIKQLSDLRARAHLLLVGIARDAGDLVLGHASLRRHLTAIGLRRFDRASADRLLDEGERRTGLRFAPEARWLIAGLASGSPYHLRLFAFGAAMLAIDRGEAVVTEALLGEALPDAYEDWAALSPAAAALFGRLAAEGPARRRRLEALATEALEAGDVTPEALARRLAASVRVGGADAAADTIERLRPALAPASDGRGLVFEDTLAPQFLLLACCLAEHGRQAGRNAA